MDAMEEDTMTDIVMEDCHHDSNKNTPCDTAASSSSSSPSKDELDVEKLFNLLEASKSAGDLIADKDVLLLIGLTGAGKTTSTLYLAGATFEVSFEKGFIHYKPSNLPASMLSEFAVSGGASSVTKTIHATNVRLSPDTEDCITICDTPGFGDTNGPEMEISNGLGTIHALKRAASIKPVVTLDYKGMSTSRWLALRQTLSTVIAMMGRDSIDFSSFSYIFTRCPGDESELIHMQLASFQETIRENQADIVDANGASVKDILDAMLTDMIAKTKPDDVICINPRKPKDAPATLKRLWTGGRIGDPSTSFVNFCTKDSLSTLLLQVTNTLDEVENALKEMNLKVAKDKLGQMIRLADALSLRKVHDNVLQARKKVMEITKERLENSLQALDISAAKDMLGQMIQLADVVSLPEMREAIDQGRKKMVQITLNCLEKSLQSSDVPAAESTVSKLIGLDKVLSSQEVNGAVKRACEKSESFVAQVLSEIQSLVSEMQPDDVTHTHYKQLALAMAPKLQLLSQTGRICNYLSMAFDYNAFRDATFEKLFATVWLASPDGDAGNDLRQSQGQLQGAIIRLSCLVDIFKALFEKETIATKCRDIIENLSARIKSVLTPVQTTLEKPTCAALKEHLDAILCLLDMQSFLNTTETSFPGVEQDHWSWFEKDLGGLLGGLLEKGQYCSDGLDKQTIALTSVPKNQQGWPSSSISCSSVLPQSTCIELQEYRGFLLALSSSDPLQDAVYSDSNYDPGLVVANFDLALTAFLTSFADYLAYRAKRLREDDEAEPSSAEKDAKDLLDMATDASASCSALKDSNPKALGEVEKMLLKIQTELQCAIDEAKARAKRPGHGIRRLQPLEPSRAELARATTPQAKKGLQIWYAKAAELRAYKIKNGHCDVPQKDPRLGKWVSKQRTEKKKWELRMKTAMTDEKLEHLAALDFSWAPQKQREEETWNLRFEELKQFKSENGHCRVPQRAGKLGKWVANQRACYGSLLAGKSHYNRAILNKEKLGKLKKFGLFDDM